MDLNKTYHHVVTFLLLALMALPFPLLTQAKQAQRDDIDVLISPERMESSLKSDLVRELADLTDMKAKMEQLEARKAAIRAEISAYSYQDTAQSYLLMVSQPRIDELEEALRKNWLTSRILAKSVETFQAYYNSISMMLKKTADGVDLAKKQMADIRQSQLSDTQKDLLEAATQKVLDVLKEKKQLGEHYLKIYEDMLDQMKAKLKAKKVIAEKLSARLKDQKKASLFTRSEPYRGLGVQTFQERLQVFFNRIKALFSPEFWKTQWINIQMGGIARWAVFLFALTLVVALQGRGRRFLQRIEKRCDGPGFYYRRMGLHLLHRSLTYIGLTLLFGIYSSFHFSLLNVGLGRFLFSIFLVLLVTRWGLDYLNYGFQGPSTVFRSFVTLHLKRFFQFFRAVAIVILMMIGLIGSGGVLVWIVRDVLSAAVLVWAIILWRQMKPMVVQGSREDTPPYDSKWIGLSPWGLYLICGGTPLLSLFGYYNLARLWTTAWLETLALLFWGWISLNAIREWHNDHLAKVKAADSEHPLGSVDDFQWAMIQLARLIWFMVLTAGILWAWDGSGYLFSQLGRFINATLTVGYLELSIKGIMVAAFILYVTRLLVHIGQSLLNEKVLDKKTLEPGLKDSILTIISYLAWGLGLIFALGILGVNATSLAVIFGALSIGIGFGLQNIFNNFISGLILLFERPIQVGDVVEVAGLWAEVKKINVRATLVQTFDNASMIIPNSEFISQQVTNWSYKDKRMRRNIEVGVAYGSDIDLVQKTLLEIAEKHRKVLKSPRPDVLFINHADSALIFRLRIWFHVDDYWTVPSQIRCDIDRRFRELAIEIAFPQRDLHIRTLPNEMTSVASSGDRDRVSPSQEPAMQESSHTD